jgi:electron transfer flavoprotein beta subunit
MTEVVEIDYPRPRPKNISVPDSRLNGFERVLWLLSGSRTEKKGSVLEGPPEAMASEIIRFLMENGVTEI